MTDRELQNKGRTMSSEALTFGFTLLLGSYLFFRAGSWLDTRLGSAPWMAILFVLAAIGGSFYRFLRNVSRLNKE